MGKMKAGQEALGTREIFNNVRKMDRTEFEGFLKSIYNKGYTAGCKETEAKHKEETAQANDMRDVGQHEKLKKEINLILSKVSGVGPATQKRISEALDRWDV